MAGNSLSRDVLLKASTIGPAVPRGSFPVTIHSVFRHAINLQPAGGGILLTVLSRPSPEQPQGILLTTCEDFTAHGLRPQSGGRFTRAGIALDRPGASALRISLAGAARTRPLPLPSLCPAPDWQAAAGMLAVLQAQASADLRIGQLLGTDPAPGLLGQRLAAAALALGGSVRSGSPDAARSALAGLMGLGCGLTPSGDDFLCGFLIAGHCRTRPDHPFLRDLKASILDRLPATNAISAAFLRCAADGAACGNLRDLAQALHHGAGFRDALASLCAFGHSSGMDLATGFLYGLSVWE